MAEKSQHLHNESLQLKPGQILKQARERLGLEQKNIASQLNLQVDTIEAVENDDAEKLPASTYVRGYIRSYARMVRLNGDELIKLYENDAAGPPEIIPDIKQHHQAASHDKPVKAVTYLITFGLALLLIAWLQSHYIVEKSTHTKETDVVETIVEETPNDSHQVYYYPDVDIKDYGFPGSELQPYSETNISPGLTSGTIGDFINDNISSDLVSSTPENTGTAISSDDQIIFTVNRDSWIEVHDSGNNRLYLGTARQGEEININGVAPFNVLLGYSPGVEVTFNGKKFNTGPFSKGGIARFTLSKPENQVHTE